MFNFDKSDFQRVVVSAVGAILLSAIMVGSAVGPARAVETAPVMQAAPVAQAFA